MFNLSILVALSAFFFDLAAAKEPVHEFWPLFWIILFLVLCVILALFACFTRKSATDRVAFVEMQNYLPIKQRVVRKLTQEFKVTTATPCPTLRVSMKKSFEDLDVDNSQQLEVDEVLEMLMTLHFPEDRARREATNLVKIYGSSGAKGNKYSVTFDQFLEVWHHETLNNQVFCDKAWNMLSKLSLEELNATFPDLIVDGQFVDIETFRTIMNTDTSLPANTLKVRFVKHITNKYFQSEAHKEYRDNMHNDFNRYDADNSGYIDLLECQAVLKDYNMSEAGNMFTAMQWMNIYGTDGQADFRQFSEIMHHHLLNGPNFRHTSYIDCVQSMSPSGLKKHFPELVEDNGQVVPYETFTNLLNDDGIEFNDPEQSHTKISIDDENPPQSPVQI